jgi:single-strand DNA-binding protein
MNLNNRVQLIGVLGENPIIKEFGSDNKMARFSMFTTDVYKRGDEYVKEVMWHTVVAWGQLAEVAEKSLCKGGEAIVDGKLVRRSYIDTKGARQYITEVVATLVMNGAGNESNVFAANKIA